MLSEYNAGVNYNLDFFESKRLWYSLTFNNGEAVSCNDAAKKRIRLGTIGIPYSDEMKTELGCYKVDNRNKYALLHCRGNQELDRKKIDLFFKSNYSRLNFQATEDVFKLQKGLINPFYFALSHPEVIQIFDFDIFENKIPPFTLMTNAGDKNWGLEFYPEQVFNAIPNAVKADIITSATKRQIKYEKIGILTGNSPESGIFLWEMMNKAIRKQLEEFLFLGDISFPEVCIESVPGMGYSMELDLREYETARAVEKGVRHLCKSGAKIIAIACNTTQYFTPMIREICREFGSTFISMAEVVEQYIARNSIQHFDFLGIKYVTDFEKWSAFKGLAEHSTIEIPSEQDLGKINELAFMVKQKSVTESSRNQLRHLIMKSAKTNVVIIALTEISILLASQKEKNRSGRIFIDTLTLLAEELATRYVNGITDALFTKINNYSDIQSELPRIG